MSWPEPAEASGVERSLEEAVRQCARDAGVDEVGVGWVKDALPEDFRHLPAGIALGVAHPAVRLLHERGTDQPQEAIERALQDHRNPHAQHVLEDALVRLTGLMRRSGYRYFCFPAEVDPMETPFSAPLARRFSHKASATCAGLGWVGRHGLLIHPVYGPLMTWATLVTDAPLAMASPVTEGRCGDCTACLEVCPGDALHGRIWTRDEAGLEMVRVERCREILDQNERATGKRICGKCAVACAAAKLPENGSEAAGPG